MLDALQQVIQADASGRNLKDGLFSAACLLHTGFSTEAPLIGGVHYLQAVGDWLFKRTTRAPTATAAEGMAATRAHVFVDDCGVMCNPTCADA
jgi:hypothetical protein